MTRTLLLMTLLAGCGRAAPTLPDDVSLADPAVVVASHPVAASRLTMTARGGLATGPTNMALPITELVLRLHTGDRPQVESLEFPLPDVDVPASALPPHGVKLRDLWLGIAGPIKVEVIHAQDDALDLHATTPLTLRWALELDDGTLWPLGPTRTRPIDLDLQVVRAAGSSTTTVIARCPGTCWEVDGVANLSDAALYLEADTTVTAP